MQDTEYRPPPSPTCGHVDHWLMKFQVVEVPPPGATSVECPCCHLGGHKTADDTDPEPMVCPYCDVEAVEVTR